MSDRFVVVPATYVIFLRADGTGAREVLLQLRRNTGFMDGHWACAAAGHVERGESVFSAAAREAAEELGVTQVALEPLCAVHRTRGGEPIDERVDFFHTATAWSGEPTVQEPAKCAALGWFPLDRLPFPVVPHEAMVLDAVRRGSVPPILVHGF